MSLNTPGRLPPLDENLQRSNKKHKPYNVTLQDSNSEETMTEATVDLPESPKSFKDTLMKVVGDDVVDACWGDLLEKELPEDKWYKPVEDELVSRAISAPYR